jgi:hypothetical protein
MHRTQSHLGQRDARKQGGIGHGCGMRSRVSASSLKPGKQASRTDFFHAGSSASASVKGLALVET